MFDMNQDYFDSRDMIERIEELEALEEVFLDPESSEEDKAEWTRELDSELFSLRTFAEYAELNCGEWHHGETFIHEDYFTAYTKDLLVDCGYNPSELPDFIADNIDWEGVADDLRVDYTEYELDGNTYYAR